MGNEIARKFHVPQHHSATGGHCSLYKIWHGKKKESPDDVSVWVFDRSELVKRKSNPVNDKTLQEQIIQLMKKDIASLKECNSCGVIQIIEVQSATCC
jgi:hypothetical protein